MNGIRKTTPLRLALAICGLAAWIMCGSAACIAPSGDGFDPPTNQTVLIGRASPGHIVVEVSHLVGSMRTMLGGQPRDRYWLYEIEPHTGRVVQTGTGYDGRKTSTFQTGRTGCDKYENKTHSVLSPDQRFQLQCGEETQTELAQFVITDLGSNEVRFRWAPPTHRRVRGFAWSSGSDFVALLSSSEQAHDSFADRVWSGAGHPPGYVTFHLDVIGVADGAMTEYELRRDVLMADGAVLDWTRDPLQRK